jgi:hypothetical protein
LPLNTGTFGAREKGLAVRQLNAGAELKPVAVAAPPKLDVNRPRLAIEATGLPVGLAARNNIVCFATKP